MTEQPPIAIDFETFFSKELNVKIQGNRRYAREADAFLVSIYGGPDGVEYVGPVGEAPWSLISWHHWVSHNAGFDSAVFAANQEKGLIPKYVRPQVWDCTADLCAYAGVGRALKVAVKNSYEVPLEKSIRDKAKGKVWPRDFKPEEQSAFCKYALEDAKFCWQLWMTYAKSWPEPEREFARVIRSRANAGVHVDVVGLAIAISTLNEYRAEAACRIPWGGETAPLSPKAVRAYCHAEGIPHPESLAEDSMECAEWEQTYGEKYPIIGALRSWRKANMYLRKCESIADRLNSDGRMTFGLKYHGAAATGRLSGTDGFNIQNLAREPYLGVDIRSLLIPAPGHKFVIADFSQIEPRIVAWLGGNKSLLKMLRGGHNLYEADARASGAWNGEQGTLKKTLPLLYQTQKAQSLGIGYGLGRDKFRAVALSQLQLNLTSAQADSIISGWHGRNPHVRVLWRKAELEMGKCLSRHEDYVVELPSGRTLKYFLIKRENRGITAVVERNSPRVRTYWGALLFENCVQAIARDALRDKVLAVESAGIPVLWTSHDELVCEVPADFDPEIIASLMREPLVWAPDLPLDAEVVSAACYLKA